MIEFIKYKIQHNIRNAIWEPIIFELNDKKRFSFKQIIAVLFGVKVFKLIKTK